MVIFFRKHLISRKSSFQNGFTLVELIVVITILTILWTIWFTSLQGYSLSARDSVRIENLSNVHKWLTLFQVKTGIYPSPEDSIVLTASGTPIWYQWSIKDSTVNLLKLSVWATKDPLDPSIYATYSVNANNTKMQLMSFLEDGSKITSFYNSPSSGEGIYESDILSSSAYASMGSDYSKRTPVIKWDTIGILLSSGSLRPVQEDYVTSSFTGVDLTKTTTSSWYIIFFSSNDTTAWVILSGTGAYTGSLFTFTYNKRDDLKCTI